MTSMKGDIVNRVKRLPKPTKASEAIQPLFEAISNAMHAVEDKFGDRTTTDGKIVVTINNLRAADEIEIVVEDNGIGLDNPRYEAFSHTDTAFKIERGSKGIGRLLWLDAFESVFVESVFMQDNVLMRRTFNFVLSADDQLTNETLTTLTGNAFKAGTIVTFKGLRGDYKTKFPARSDHFIRQFGSHFFADFILGKTSQITLHVDGEETEFPDHVLNMKREERPEITIETDHFGKIKVQNFICDKVASSSLEGYHQLHLIAAGRTVTTRKIDGLLGLGYLGTDKDLVYHGCVTGEFFDSRVNQERTQFNFDESIVEEIVKVCAENVRATALASEIETFDAGRLVDIEKFLEDYPSFGFDEPQQLLEKTPKNAAKPEDFAKALIPHKIRRDIERKRLVAEVVGQLTNSATDTPSPTLQEQVRRAADEVRSEEQRQLTEYVLKRKLVLDIMDVLINRVRQQDDNQPDHHLESTLHEFICPMRVRGDDPTKIESSDHDLWIVDERLTFSKYFASDMRLNQIILDNTQTDRPDLFIFEHTHGLSTDNPNEPLSKVMLIEFKRPGRERYDDKYLPYNQINRYLTALNNGEIETYNGRRVRLAENCVFYCYVVADIIGDLKNHVATWNKTANGRGRWLNLAGDFRGSIEVIEWSDLIVDARARNAAFIELTSA